MKPRLPTFAEVVDSYKCENAKQMYTFLSQVLNSGGEGIYCF